MPTDQISHGRQLRLFLADGTSSGPRFFEIFNRTIQALGIPATRIQELVSSAWAEFQRPGVYLVLGTNEEGLDQLYVGKGENVAKRVQAHPEKLDLEITALILFSSKDSNLNGSQVSWLESSLIRAGRSAKRIGVINIQTPELPVHSKPELATVSEFFDDLKLIAQTAGFDFFSAPKPVVSLRTPAMDAPLGATTPSPEFILNQPQKGITARGYLTDEGFVVKQGSLASATANESRSGSYGALRRRLITQGVMAIVNDDTTKLSFTVDYSFDAPSAAAAVIIGNNASGNKFWKTSSGQSLGDYRVSLNPPEPSAVT